MKFIGITGGVGAGKSELLRYIEREFCAKIILADELAHELMLPGTDCFAQIAEAFAEEDLYADDGRFSSQKLAEVIFSDSKKRDRLNRIVHPAVKREVLRMVQKERDAGKWEYVILEAALLVEEGYGEICDELWYIYADHTIRRRRLKESRGYSDEKIDKILASQLSDEEYRRRCKVVIDNNGPLEEGACQVRNALEEGDKPDGAMQHCQWEQR